MPKGDLYEYSSQYILTSKYIDCTIVLNNVTLSSFTFSNDSYEGYTYTIPTRKCRQNNRENSFMFSILQISFATNVNRQNNFESKMQQKVIHTFCDNIRGTNICKNKLQSISILFIGTCTTYLQHLLYLECSHLNSFI